MRNSNQQMAGKTSTINRKSTVITLQTIMASSPYPDGYDPADFDPSDSDFSDFSDSDLSDLSDLSDSSDLSGSDNPGPLSKNAAVEHCISIYVRTLVESSDAGRTRAECNKDAERAYRDAMPPLSGSQNICDFIACLAQAILTDVVSPAVGTRLLYAAQVAHTAAKGHTSPKKGVPEILNMYLPKKR